MPTWRTSNNVYSTQRRDGQGVSWHLNILADMSGRTGKVKKHGTRPANRSILYFIEVAPPAGFNIDVEQAIETDTAFGIGISLTIGIASEADSAFAIVPTKRIAVAQGIEADSAFSIQARKSEDINQAIEADTARVITPLRPIALNQATEADSARTITLFKSISLGQATEADSAFVITVDAGGGGGFSVDVNQAIEADSAQPITFFRSVSVDQATESDSAFTLALVKQVAVGQAIEADLALNLGLILATAVETDTALPITVFVPGDEVMWLNDVVITKLRQRYGGTLTITDYLLRWWYIDQLLETQDERIAFYRAQTVDPDGQYNDIKLDYFNNVFVP